MPADRVFEDESVVAIKDVAPQAAVHLLVIPKRQARTFDEYMTAAPPAEVADFWKKVQQVAAAAGLQEGGYRIVTNNGPNALQTVPQFHVHVLGGEPLGSQIVHTEHQSDHGHLHTEQEISP
jgi:histidine triad (HIT) family protein